MRAILLIGLLVACNGKDKDGTEPVDADGDGFSPPEDCDDADASVYPGAPDDWYDGVDHDCAGNDDYDQDGDGHVSDAFGGDDCFDGNPDISPSATEIFYDGVDNDCDPATPDTDPDGDGVVAPEDCDDGDANVYPGAPETLGDATDSDCDGDPDTAAFEVMNYQWNLPTSPRLARTDDHVALAVTASSLDTDTLAESAISPLAMLYFDPAQRGAVPPAYGPDVVLSGEPIGEVDLLADGDGVWIATTYYSNNNRYGWLSLQQATFVFGVGYVLGQVSALGAVLTDFHHMDAAFDPSGVPWACASDADAVAYIRGDAPFPSPGAFVQGVDGGSGCFFEPGGAAPLSFTTCDDAGACTTWDTDPDGPDPAPVPSASQPRAGEDWRSVRARDELVVAIPDGDGAVVIDGASSYDVLGGDVVLDADAVLDASGELWVAAVVEATVGTQLVLASGTPGGALSELVFPVVDEGFEYDPVEAALWVEDDLVVLAVTAERDGTDVVGWVLLSR